MKNANGTSTSVADSQASLAMARTVSRFKVVTVPLVVTGLLWLGCARDQGNLTVELTRFRGHQVKLVAQR
jgi:hypothetical protein